MLMSFTNNTDSIARDFQDFSHRFKVGGILRSCGAHKQKGIEVMKVFYYLCTLLFCRISMNRDQNTRGHGNMVKKDACHRFLQLVRMDWNRFLSLLAQAVIVKDFIPIRRNDCDGKEKPFFLVADDSSYCRNRSKKVELSAKNWDHALKRYYKGFRMLTLPGQTVFRFFPYRSATGAHATRSSCSMEPRSPPTAREAPSVSGYGNWRRRR